MRTKGAKNKPKLVLKEMPNTAVFTTTEAKYDELMKIYKRGGWTWFFDGIPKWDDLYSGVEAENSFIRLHKDEMRSRHCLSLSEFKKLQGLDPEEPKTIKPKFKVGDVVYATCIYGNKTGDMCLGTIIGIDGLVVSTQAGRHLSRDVYKLPSKKRSRPRGAKYVPAFPFGVHGSIIGTHTIGEAKAFSAYIPPTKSLRTRVNKLNLIEPLTYFVDPQPQAPTNMQLMEKINEIINHLNKQ